MMLDDMESRAQRHLDGMTVNRDAMARDVLKLCQAIRSAQKRAAERQPQSGTPKPDYSGTFDDLFGSFGRSRKS